MTSCYSKIFSKATLTLLITQQTCFTATQSDLLVPDNQNAVRRPSATIASQTSIPTLSNRAENLIDAIENLTRLEDHLPAIEQINKQLLTNYGHANPSIKLALHTHAEISRLSAKYEQFPQVSYNHDENQVTLTWETGSWGIFKQKTRAETFYLARRVVASLVTASPLPNNVSSGLDG